MTSESCPFGGIEPASLREEHLDYLLTWAINFGCSDIVLTSDQPIRVKRNGRYEEVTTRRLTTEEIGFLIRHSSESQNAAADVGGGRPWDYAYDVLHGDSAYRFRVNAVSVLADQGQSGFEVTIRALQGIPPAVEELGLEPSILDFLESSGAGLYLTAGPTGSGKTTTQAAVLVYLRQRKNSRIITFEAPVEYNLAPFGISQTSIPRGIANFETAVVNALRRAPDVIVLGEARDQAAMSGALQASETGHAVFTSIHSPSVSGVLPRFVEAFPRGEQRGIARRLVESLRWVVYQRLVPCQLGGRIGIRESLCVTSAVQERLRQVDADELGAAFRTCVSEFGVTLAADARAKYAGGLISQSTLESLLAESGDEA